MDEVSVYTHWNLKYSNIKGRCQAFRSFFKSFWWISVYPKSPREKKIEHRNWDSYETSDPVVLLAAMRFRQKKIQNFIKLTKRKLRESIHSKSFAIVVAISTLKVRRNFQNEEWVFRWHTCHPKSIIIHRIFGATNFEWLLLVQSLNATRVRRTLYEVWHVHTRLSTSNEWAPQQNFDISTSECKDKVYAHLPSVPYSLTLYIYTCRNATHQHTTAAQPPWAKRTVVTQCQNWLASWAQKLTAQPPQITYGFIYYSHTLFNIK